MNGKQISTAIIITCAIIFLSFLSLQANIPIIKNYFKNSMSKNLLSDLKTNGNLKFQYNSDTNTKNSNDKNVSTPRADKEVNSPIAVNFVKYDADTLYFTVENYSNEKITFSDCAITIRGVSDLGNATYTNCSGQKISLEPTSAKVIRFNGKTIRNQDAIFTIYMIYDSQTAKNQTARSPEFMLWK